MNFRSMFKIIMKVIIQGPTPSLPSLRSARSVALKLLIEVCALRRRRGWRKGRDITAALAPPHPHQDQGNKMWAFRYTWESQQQ